MKKTALLYLAALLPLWLGSCDSSDDSTLPKGALPTIELGDFPEEGYTVVSYEGNHLQITPEITTTYPESQLTYRWLLQDQAAADRAYQHYPSLAYAGEVISEERNLDYEVNLAPGTYKLMLDVTAQNGYSVGKQTTLLTITNFTTGYYILKETATGQTEFDIFQPAESHLIENLFTATTGSPLAGTPCMLSMASDHAYIDEDTNAEAGSNIATITTQEGDIRCLRTGDLKCVLDNSSILFDAMDASERPYLIASGGMSTYFLSSEGVRAQYGFSMMGGTGRYGVAGGGGGSRFAVFDVYGFYIAFNFIFWDEATKSISSADYNGGVVPIEDAAFPVNNLTGWDCLACGWSNLAGGAVFLLQEKATGKRQLITIASKGFMGVMAQSQTDVSPDSHLAKGSVFTVSNSSASFIYTVDGNRIYGYDVNTGEEQEITAQGVGSETIAYISDKWIGSSDTDYFVVGTQQGDQYTLRFYNQLGGKLDGAPVYTTTGTGRVVSIMYTATSLPDQAIQD